MKGSKARKLRRKAEEKTVGHTEQMTRVFYQELKEAVKKLK